MDKPPIWEKDLRIEIGRVLHKALRQFEIEDYPEAFDMKVHISHLISKFHAYYKGELNEAAVCDARIEALIKRIQSYFVDTVAVSYTHLTLPTILLV